MSVLGIPFRMAGSAATHVLNNSAWFDGAADELTLTPAGTGGSRTVMTVEAVVQRCELGVEQFIFGASDTAGNNTETIHFTSTDKLQYRIHVGGAEVVSYVTTMQFLDTTAWYFIHVTRNGNTVTITVNGVEVAGFDTSDAPTGDSGMLGHTEIHRVGRKVWAANAYLDGYIARLAYLDGVSSGSSNFGEFDANGVWVPVDISGLDYGANGFLQLYENSAYFGADSSAVGVGYTPDSKFTGGTASSSAGTAANAFDDNISTICNFATQTMPQYVRYDLGSGNDADITKVVFDIEQVNAADFDWEINYSDDNWSGTANAASGSHASSLDPVITTHTSVGSHRYWEIRLVDHFTSSSNASIAEVSGFATGDGINHFTDVSMTAAQQTTHSPTDDVDNDVGGYCLPNAVQEKWGIFADLSNGNLTVKGDGTAAVGTINGTLTFAEGKFIWASKPSANSTAWDCDISVSSDDMTQGALLQTAGNWGIRFTATPVTAVWEETSTATPSTSPNHTVGDYLLMAVDADNLKAWPGWHDVSTGTTYWWNASAADWTGDPAAGTGGMTITGSSFWAAFGVYGTRGGEVDFGQGSLLENVTIPTGFKFLHTGNLPAPTVKSMSEGVVTAEALGSAIVADLNTAKSDAGWGSDAHIDVFYRKPTAEGTPWVFSDDASNALIIQTNAAAATTPSLTGADAYLGVSYRIGAKYGLATGTQAHTNGGGDTDIAHGLGAGAKMAWLKMSSTTGEWLWSHPALTANYNLEMSTTNVETATQHVDIDDTNLIIKSAAPTGTYRWVAWVEVEGFLDIGKYTGNASVTDGPFISMHIKPEIGVMGHIDAGGGYGRYMHQRVGSRKYNIGNTGQFHDISNNVASEVDAIWAGEDPMATGIKVGSISNEVNGSGKRYLTLMHGNPVGGVGVAQARAR